MKTPYKSDKKNYLPHIPIEIIEYLEQVNPIRLPEVHESERVIFVEVGRQQIINQLRQLYNKQNQ